MEIAKRKVALGYKKLWPFSFGEEGLGWGWEMGERVKERESERVRVVNWGRLKTEFVSGGPEPRVYKNFFDFLSRTYPPHTCIDNHHSHPPKLKTFSLSFYLHNFLFMI